MNKEIQINRDFSDMLKFVSCLLVAFSYYYYYTYIVIELEQGG